MVDLTLLHYTDNIMPYTVAKRIRDYVVEITENRYPIVSISQKPIDFGKNICVGEIGKSKYNLYKQVWTGVKEVRTKYVACIEDDTLYSKEHFDYRPKDGYVAYDNNYWFAQEWREYFWRVDKSKRNSGGMWGCIADTKYLKDNLTKRFSLYPTNPFVKGAKPNLPFGEPGYRDEVFGMENKRIIFTSKKPCLIFLHRTSIGFMQWQRYHRRYGFPKEEDKRVEIKQFGTVNDIYKKFWGR